MNADTRKKDKTSAAEQTGPVFNLVYDHRVRLMSETVRSMVRGRKVHNILHAPSHEGDVSINLLEKAERITMIDRNPKHLKMAANKISKDRMGDMRFIRGDVARWENTETFDLVVCIDELARQPDPERFLADMTQRVSRGGYIIVQNQNGLHPFSLVARTWGLMTIMFRNSAKRRSWTSHNRLMRIMKVYGFMPRKRWRFNGNWTLLGRLLDNQQKYAATRAWYGRLRESRLQPLGADNVYLFKRL